MSEENIKAALQYAVKLSEEQTVVHEINGKNWVDIEKGRLTELEPIQYATTLEVNTLSGLVDFLKQKFDWTLSKKLLIQVDSPTDCDSSISIGFKSKTGIIN